MATSKNVDQRRNDQRLAFRKRLERIEKELDRRVSRGEKLVLQTVPVLDPLGYPKLRIVKSDK